MNARRTLVAIATTVLLIAGCKSTGSVPDADSPGRDPSLDIEPPPERSLEHAAGIIISSDPSLEVTVDGKPVGTTPLTVEHLSSGPHEVTFIDPEEGNATYTVDLGEGEFQKLHHSRSPDASDAKLKK